ncbi:HAD superfamily hydrolase (TIGR01450 family) [Mycolicibacterium sp. BK556]|uniref:HAD-IIA family hydrolase n=1 Tax=unclassified Mycolicibacterium TaxID=2636767 RepID=UPI0016206ED7|nr:MULTISPECIES: HAD-IIA family hydrolase [unclassified Mycolicibacterium]MBB3606330.1 HAD superfamily hydrolase (TIGR01450 family) [Mycolicibacterium sp. BK556]MBB3632909.1 HAD superfamily hydrolase (TIGR01450 family) [Mycolicibacterium sp. BK607]MBB3754496.1 HAD superfamily hydrolase (TIGR01450 family) [Mycolicibacterium sp. BK634]
MAQIDHRVAEVPGALVDAHDCLLLDLDGTVFRGHSPTPGAVEVLAAVGARKVFVTNNASRGAAEVADHLVALGFAAEAGDVVTSAQSAARAISRHLPPSSTVLVLGTDSLATEIARVGLKPVRLFSDAPVAVVQGHSPLTGWADLAEAMLCIRDGGLWVATNADVTLPTDRGLLPGNGSMVAALRAATGMNPDVIGKPAPTMLRDALSRGAFHAPLVIGDRLDTDIAAANASGFPSVLVLSGVSTPTDVISAPDGLRPTYLAEDLRGLREPEATLRIGAQPGWCATVAEGAVTLTSEGGDDELAALRVVADAAWRAGTSEVVAGDRRSRDALQRWGLG